MRILYRAENIIDANLVKNALAQAGIEAYVTGEYLTGAAGQLPAFGLVNVMVADEDEAAAAPIAAEIDEMLREAAAQGAPDLPEGWLTA
jgi:hypothetical protein